MGNGVGATMKIEVNDFTGQIGTTKFCLGTYHKEIG